MDLAIALDGEYKKIKYNSQVDLMKILTISRLLGNIPQNKLHKLTGTRYILENQSIFKSPLLILENRRFE